jgi:Fe-S-cluster containining protein
VTDTLEDRTMRKNRQAQDRTWVACRHVRDGTATEVRLYPRGPVAGRAAVCKKCSPVRADIFRMLPEMPPAARAPYEWMLSRVQEERGECFHLAGPEELAALLRPPTTVIGRQFLNRDLLRERRRARREDRHRAEHSGTPRRRALPLLTADDCRGCGACCRHVGHPMFMRHLPAESAADYASDRRSPGRSERAWVLLPIHLKQEFLAYLEQTGGGNDDGEPCYWLDPDGTCRHYEHRPRVCEWFEVGGEACRRFVRESRQED